MLQIKKNYFHTTVDLGNIALKEQPETHFVLTTNQTNNLCKMAQTYAIVSELAGQLEEEEEENNKFSIPVSKRYSLSKKRAKCVNIVTTSLATLAQKIISPLTRAFELEGISEELIKTVKEIASNFKQMGFPQWFSDPDKKKRVTLDLVFKDTLKLHPYWSSIPFTTMNRMTTSTENISMFIIDIFRAVYPNYTSKITFISSKNGLKELPYAQDVKLFL